MPSASSLPPIAGDRNWLGFTVTRHDAFGEGAEGGTRGRVRSPELAINVLRPSPGG